MTTAEEWLDELLALDSPDALDAYLADVPPHLRAEALAWLRSQRPPWQPQVHQRLPEDDRWFGFLMLGGRGAGKTVAAAWHLNNHAMGPPCMFGEVPHRMGIIAPTLGDASKSVVHGPGALTTINPEVRETTRKGGTVVLWPNGAEAMLFGCHTEADVDRLRAGGGRCFDVREEVAAWRYLAEGMDQADAGLREGEPYRKWIGATTPRPRPTIKRLVTDPKVRVSRATTADNRFLDSMTRERLYEQFGGTRFGLQELEAVILEEVSGALFDQEMIDQHRVSVAELPPLEKVRAYVDPSWGTTHDECGIVIAGVGVPNEQRGTRHLYVLADLSRRVTPTEWGLLAWLGWLPEREQINQPGGLRAAEQRDFFGYRVQRVCMESNFQREQGQLVIRTVESLLGVRVPNQAIEGRRGKRLRAEPVVALFEQGRVHLVGRLPGLEWQLVSWVPPDKAGGEDIGDPATAPGDEGEDRGSSWSPDRLDAFVYSALDLLLGGAGVAIAQVPAGRLPPIRPSEHSRSSQGARRIPASSRQADIVRRQLDRG